MCVWFLVLQCVLHTSCSIMLITMKTMRKEVKMDELWCECDILRGNDVLQFPEFRTTEHFYGSDRC